MPLPNHVSPTFRYVRVANSLRDQILAGTYQPRDCLPRRHDLAKQHNVAFSTVKQAMDLLEGQGYVIRKVDQGTYSSLPKQHRPVALVVDDDPGILRFLTRALVDEGWDSVSVASGEEALAKLDDNSFDLIFLDLVMPGMSGVDTFRLIRAAQPGIQVVIITAYPESSLMAEALEAGPFALMKKPIYLEFLDAILGYRMAALQP